jgi:hypothetical protein
VPQPTAPPQLAEALQKTPKKTFVPKKNEATGVWGGALYNEDHHSHSGTNKVQSLL